VRGVGRWQDLGQDERVGGDDAAVNDSSQKLGVAEWGNYKAAALAGTQPFELESGALR
jgi:hypothetical protein